MTATGSVVVGADGSPAARTAIEYALQDAARRGARLRVVAAGQLPQYWAGGYAMPAIPAPAEIAEEMRSIAHQQVDEIRNAHPELATVPVTVEGATGAPGSILVEAADGADLLVLGHRGRGAMRSALLGSVGLHCILHATCPVTIVRPAKVAEPVPTAVADVAAAQA
jgi:nucleotide-binding universal stress UspA family protein